MTHIGVDTIFAVQLEKSVREESMIVSAMFAALYIDGATEKSVFR